ncbi:secretion protein EspK [Mycobacterium sp. ML4]
MGIAKPVGCYAEKMLDPDAWPEADEDIFFDRAHEWTKVLRQVTEVLDASRYQQAEIFESGRWSGSGAAAADGELRGNINELIALQNKLVTVITWQRYVAGSIVQAKSDITDNVEIANRQIDVIANNSSMEANARVAAINALISQTHTENAGVVAGTAEQIMASKSWKPPDSALKDLLDQKIPPPVTLPADPQEPLTPPAEYVPPPVSPPRPVPDNTARDPSVETPRPTPSPRSPESTPSEPRRTPADGTGPGGAMSPAPPTTPSGPAGPSSPATPSGPAGPFRPAEPAPPLRPAASTKPSGGGAHGTNMAPVSEAGQSPSLLLGPVATEASSASAGAGGVPAMPMAPGGSGAGGATRSGGGAAAPVEKPSEKARQSTRPATATRAAGTAQTPDSVKAGSTRHESSIERSQDGAAAMIPVSAARAERDAIAEAATADAARRKGVDPLRLGRRIAAALNAPSSRTADLGFFWITAVTTDGAIVVANSYGLAYLPDGVRLPDEVHMASADSTIPATERARWATYPVMAVRGWAAHHDRELRVVIGTERQLANSDSGAATVVLKPDDIPDSGDMRGRARLEVVDPSAAARLATTPDARLIDLLPPAPVVAEPPAEQTPPPEAMKRAEPSKGAPVLPARMARRARVHAPLPPEPATASAPDDQRTMLWLAVSKPLASSHPDRQGVHLRAFRAYATRSQEVLLGEAHTASDPVAQRYAVADWLYWKYLAQLLDAALADAS